MLTEQKQQQRVANRQSDAFSLNDELFLERVIAVLRTVFCPGSSTNVYDLGFIYSIDRLGEDGVSIAMAANTPCGSVTGSMPGMVERVVKTASGIRYCQVQLVRGTPPNNVQRAGL